MDTTVASHAGREPNAPLYSSRKARPMSAPIVLFSLGVGLGACGDGEVAKAAAPAASSLPDLHKGTEKGMCSEIQGARVPGADSYFFDTFTIEGDAVNGSEIWELTANQTWKEKGGNDCTIEWRLVGSKVAPKACLECDFGLSLTSSPLPGNSKCPEDLVKREAKAGRIEYDVKLRSDGTALFYFSGSGRMVGEGYHQGGELNFRTPHQCKWF
jgi:hypothetical protein